MKTSADELADGRRTFDDCDSAAVVLGYYLVEEGSITGVVGDAQENLFTVVVSKVPSHAFWKYQP